ncbi:MAG: cyclase family protein [Lachnospiraceae bacterium]|nr:cyclase family protein [Lachnospiraceae bacterium]
MLIDVSYPYTDSMAVYPNNPKFSIERVQDLEKGDSANVSLITIGSHTGTHMDAPSHFLPDGKTLDQIPLEAMNGTAKLLDLQGNKIITKELLENYEICAGDIIILKTDNSKVFHGDIVLNDYVTLDYEAAEYLVWKKIKMVCIDYMTIERPREKREQGRSVHSILLSNQILIAEALNLSNVEKGNYQLYCFPLNIVGADGASVRMVLSV